MMKKLDFLHVDTNSWKLKDDWKILGWVWSKMGVATLVSGQKLAVSQEGINGINWYSLCS